jgi:hypothetical protein
MSPVQTAFGGFPADTFTILAFCESCGHSGPVDRDRVPEGCPTEAVLRRLRCTACGAREASIRILYTGAGGFRYGDGTPALR